jgi:asparagine synthase (glutamine-hydrolysing)
LSRPPIAKVQFNTLPLIIHWDQEHDQLVNEPAVICLWSAGFLANRAELHRRYALSPEASDSEILLAAYRQEGTTAGQRLVGPFAWVIWDGPRQQLVAGRDRMGACHLYYVTTDHTFAIAHQVEQLLPWLPPPPQPNPRSLVAHLNGLPLLPGETHYADIHALDPGSFLIAGRDRVETGRYWQLQPQPTLKLPSDDAYAEAHRAILDKVIGDYLDPRPMGITLSSGLDSTTIAATLKGVQPSADLTAFSWITPELPEADESEYIKAVWQTLDMPGVAIYADQHWPLSAAEGIHTYRSSPFYNYYTDLWAATFQAMQQHGIRVAFTGMSMDFQFGGHHYAYLELLLTGQWLELYRQTKVIRTFSPYNWRKLLWRMLLRPAIWAFFPRRQQAIKLPVPWLTPTFAEIYNQSFRPPALAFSRRPASREIREWIGGLWPPQVVEQNNRQAAEYGIALYHPLIDHRLLEYALSLPLPQTIRAGRSKVIVRHALRGRLPDSIVNLRAKILPTAIAHRGLREREQDKVLALLTNMRAAEMGIVDERKLKASYQSYVLGAHANTRFWNAITLEDWLRRYF